MRDIMMKLLLMVSMTLVFSGFVDCHPVPDEEQLYVSTPLHNSNTSKSISDAANIGLSNPENASNKMIKRKYTFPKTNFPPSPVGLLRPDTFQFYTFNQNGDVVMKQMSETEIQSLIASSGGHFPTEIHEPQHAAEIPTGETKVADVVQNVQNVLKAELNKPPSVMSSVPTIPGHDNSDWSNILPSILAGDMEPDEMSKPNHSQDVHSPEGVAQNPILDPNPEPFSPIKTEAHHTKPMIPVAVITVEQPPSYINNENVNDSLPVFHILNTITADKKDSVTPMPNQTQATVLKLDQMFGLPESVTPCALVKSNCSNQHLLMMKIPNDKLQANDRIMENNSTTNGAETGHSPIVGIAINETISNYEADRPRPLLISNTIVTKYDAGSSLHLNVLSLNKTNGTMNLEKINNSSQKNQSHVESGEFNIPELSTGKPIFTKTPNEFEATTATPEIPSIPHHMESPQIEMSMMKWNSSIDHQIPIDDNNNQINTSQMQDEVSNNRNNVLNRTVMVPQTEAPENACCDRISSAPFENIPHKSPSSVAPSEYLDTFTTPFTNIPQIDELNSSTTIYVQRSTISPISDEKSTTNIKYQTTNVSIINSNPNAVNEVVVPDGIHTLPTIATATVSEDTLPNNGSIATEPIPTELANSLSSMISQISEMMPSIIPPPNDDDKSQNSTEKGEVSDEINAQPTKIYETKPGYMSTKKVTMNMSVVLDHMEVSQSSNTLDNSPEIDNRFQDKPKINFESNQKHTEEHKKEIIEVIHETPIVRIDIMESMPNIIDKKMNATPVNKDDDNSPDDGAKTESPMVRIKLTDPISTLNHLLESSPIQTATQHEIEIVTFPINRNISANGIGSGLIAGFTLNTNETTSLKYLESHDNTEANRKVLNGTSENINGITEKSILTMNSTTFTPNTEIRTESEDITHIPSSYSSEEDMVETTGSSSITEAMEMINLSRCAYQNSSKQNVFDNASLCSTSKNAVRVYNETVTYAKEKDVTKIQRFTTIPPFASTRLLIENETLQQEVTTDNSIIIESTEMRVTDTTDINMKQMLNKIQLEDGQSSSQDFATTPGSMLKSQPSSTEHVSEFSGIGSVNSSSDIGHSMVHESRMNHTLEQTFMNLQPELSSVPKLTDTVKNNSVMMTLNRMKDENKDNSKIGSTETVVAGKISTVSLKSDNTSKTIQNPVITNKLNILQKTETEKWLLIPQENHFNSQNISSANTNPLEQRIAVIQKESEKSSQANALSRPKGALGLDSSIKKLDANISYFSILCNDLAFKYWSAVNSGLSTSRSIALSPFGMTSILAMLFLGARSPTSDRMNEVLKLDDVTSFNPHLIFQNVTDSVGIAQNQGISNVAFVRELFADQSKTRKLMRFYKRQAEQFYDGMVEQVNFSTIGDAIRRKTNFLIRKQTGGRIRNFVESNMVSLRSPLAVLSANVFQTDCNSNDATSRGRDGELYFAVSPAIRQRKLVLVPATLWKAGVLAGYEPSLDATAYAIGGIDKIVSTIFVIPGQQGSAASDDNLDLLEQRIISGVLHDAAWNKLLKVIVPRPGLELHIPKFSHKSVINATAALKLMGLEELFLQHADFKGINGVGNDFHLADVIQMNLFSTCGDENIQSGKTKHHIEVYPVSLQRNARESEHKNKKTATGDHGINQNILNSSKSSESMTPSTTAATTTTTTQTKNEDKPRVKLDKPFLYFIRHNPTGLILFMGRFNPRLLP